MPQSVRRHGESYWKSVEIPVATEWVFLVNVDEVGKKQLGARTLVVASVEALMELIVEVGSSAILSASSIASTESDTGQVFAFVPLSEISVGEHSGDGWKKVFLCWPRDRSLRYSSSLDVTSLDQIDNLVSVIKFADSICQTGSTLQEP